MLLTYISCFLFIILIGSIFILPFIRKKRKLLILIENGYPINNFILFLYNHDVYERFLNNLGVNNTLKKKSFEHLFETLYKNTSPTYYVSNAFVWNDTKEGFDYWDNINNKWLKNHKRLYREQNKKEVKNLIKYKLKL